MNFEQILIEKFTELSLEKALTILAKLFKKPVEEIQGNLDQGFSANLQQAISFSDTLSVFKLPNTKEIFSNSIHLEIAKQNRQFLSQSDFSIIDEVALLNSPHNIVLLGDVGAGKTTTLKRLVKKTFQLLFEGELNSFPFSYPIVVRLGEIKPTETLITHLCSKLGICYNTIEVKEYYNTKSLEREKYYDNKTNEYFTKEKEVEREKERIRYEYKIGDYAIEIGLSHFLNDLNTIIFLDGLDEIHFSIKDAVFEDIKKLSHLLNQSKIILSSRYIQEIGTFKEFVQYQICALTSDQQLEICKLWLGNPTEFIHKLKMLPYHDLADRPLFITFLILLFINNNNDLPTQSIDVYRQIVLLVIREWDDDKEITVRRFSKYKTFDTLKKEDFLSELTFHLTFQQNVKKTFSHRQLEVAYLNTYRRYSNLSLSDETDIIKDIESHNGLLIETANRTFEFSHLSLQEYLCAKYLVSVPFSREHYAFLNIYAEPFAIANILSPRPDAWFAALFLNNINEVRDSYKLKSERIYEFLGRLIVERIKFPDPSAELGLALIYLKASFQSVNLQKKIREFSTIEFVYESLILAQGYYKIEQNGDNIYFTSKGRKSDLNIDIMEKGCIKVENYWKQLYSK